MVSPTENEENTEIQNSDQQISEDSSTSENLDAQTTGDSSTSGESDSEETTLDAVNAALKKDSDDEDETEDSSEKETSTDGEDESKDKSESDEDDSDDEMSEEEMSALKHKTRKRIQQLQGKYRDAKTENTELKQKLETVEVDAGHYRQFTQFLNSNGINQDEANQLFNIGALMKNDPMRALQMITPYYNQLLEVTGNVLPRDLQEQVQQGYITEEHALALSRERATNRNHQVRQYTQQQHQQQENIQRQQKLNSDIQTALANLEQKWTSDPDYKMKSTRIQERVKLMWYEAAKSGQMPNSVEQAVQMAEQAKQDVEAEIRSYMPKRKPINAPIDGGNAPSSKPAPNSTLDVINQTVGG